jgi:hypothetical protein
VYEGPVDENDGAGFSFRKLFIRTLLSHGADPDIQNKYNEDAIQAAQAGNLKPHQKERDEVVKMLKDHKERKNSPGGANFDDEELFTKAVKRLVNNVNTDNDTAIEKIVGLRDKARDSGLEVYDKVTHVHSNILLQSINKKWSIKKIIELVWANAVGDASIFGSIGSSKKGGRNDGKGNRTVALQYCKLFTALREANPGFDVADYVIQVGAQMLKSRLQPDLHKAAIAEADRVKEENERKKAKGISFQPRGYNGEVRLFMTDARAKMRNLCKFASLLVLRNFLPQHATVRGLAAPLAEEIGRLHLKDEETRPHNILLATGALVDMLDMMQQFNKDARFVPLLLNCSLLLQSALVPLLKAEYNLSGEVGGLAYSLTELLGKLYSWHTNKQRGLSRNAAEGRPFQRGGSRPMRLMRRSGGDISKSRFGTGDARAYRPPGGHTFGKSSSGRDGAITKPKSPQKTPDGVIIPITVTEALEWTPVDKPNNRLPFQLHNVLTTIHGSNAPEITAVTKSKIAVLVTLTIMQPIEDVASSPEMLVLRQKLETAGSAQQQWLIMHILAYASQWPGTDSRTHSKFACLLQHLKSACSDDVYSSAVQKVHDFSFSNPDHHESVVAVTKLAESGDFNKQINEMFNDKERQELHAIFRSLGGAPSGKTFQRTASVHNSSNVDGDAPRTPSSPRDDLQANADLVARATSAVGSLSTKKMTAFVYELLQFVVTARRSAFIATRDPALAAIEHMIHSEAVDADMVIAAQECIEIQNAESRRKDSSGPSDEALNEIQSVIEQFREIRSLVRELTLSVEQRTEAAFSSMLKDLDNASQPLQECITILSRNFSGKPSAEAEVAIADLLVGEALVQITQGSQCVALIELFKSPVISSMVSEKALEQALQSARDKLEVFQQVNPAAKNMLRYLVDPSLVEADAKAAEAEANKNLRGRWRKLVNKIGKTAREKADDESVAACQDDLDELLEGIRQHPVSDRSALVLELMCAGVENISKKPVQEAFTTAFASLARDAVFTKSALDEDQAEILVDIIVDLPNSQKDQAKLFIQELLKIKELAPEAEKPDKNTEEAEVKNEVDKKDAKDPENRKDQGSEANEATSTTAVTVTAKEYAIESHASCDISAKQVKEEDIAVKVLEAKESSLAQTKTEDGRTVNEEKPEEKESQSNGDNSQSAEAQSKIDELKVETLAQVVSHHNVAESAAEESKITTSTSDTDMENKSIPQTPFEVLEFRGNKTLRKACEDITVKGDSMYLKFADSANAERLPLNKAIVTVHDATGGLSLRPANTPRANTERADGYFIVRSPSGKKGGFSLGCSAVCLDTGTGRPQRKAKLEVKGDGDTITLLPGLPRKILNFSASWTAKQPLIVLEKNRVMGLDLEDDCQFKIDGYRGPRNRFSVLLWWWRYVHAH